MTHRFECHFLKLFTNIHITVDLQISALPFVSRAMSIFHSFAYECALACRYRAALRPLHRHHPCVSNWGRKKKLKKKSPHTDNMVTAAGMNSDCNDTWPKCSIQQHELLHGGKKLNKIIIHIPAHSRGAHSQHQILSLMDVQAIIKKQKWRLCRGSMERFCSSNTWMDDPPASDLILGCHSHLSSVTLLIGIHDSAVLSANGEAGEASRSVYPADAAAAHRGPFQPHWFLLRRLGVFAHCTQPKDITSNVSGKHCKKKRKKKKDASRGLSAGRQHHIPVWLLLSYY